jgi:hypothetical protein
VPTPFARGTEALNYWLTGCYGGVVNHKI